MERKDKATYATDHLYVAAFLVCKGHPIVGTTRDGDRVKFLFSETASLSSDAASFLAGGHVVARDYSFEILKLKRLIPRNPRPNDQRLIVKKNEDYEDRSPQ